MCNGYPIKTAAWTWAFPLPYPRAQRICDCPPSRHHLRWPPRLVWFIGQSIIMPFSPSFPLSAAATTQNGSSAAAQRGRCGESSSVASSPPPQPRRPPRPPRPPGGPPPPRGPTRPRPPRIQRRAGKEAWARFSVSCILHFRKLIPFKMHFG